MTKKATHVHLKKKKTIICCHCCDHRTFWGVTPNNYPVPLKWFADNAISKLNPTI